MDSHIDKSFSYAITEDEKDRRLDTFLASRLNKLTRSRIQSLIRDGNVKVNKLTPKPSYRLKTGDSIILNVPPPVPCVLEPERVDFSLVHEDSSLIVLNKPPGLVIHPAPGHTEGTLVHGLLHHCRDLSGIGGVLRPGIVHRLDKDTSGLMVVAKNDPVHTFLSSQFKAGMVNKRYLALVHDVMDGMAGEIDLLVSRNPHRRKEMAVVPSRGKRALTLWRKIEEIGDRFTFLDVALKTGRTHQIRVHLSHQGHPIVGDRVYGHRSSWWKKKCPRAMELLGLIKRQMLHAERLGFVHPESKEYCEYSAPIPADMDRVIQGLKQLFY